jgi:hypothetical protein
VQEAIASAQGGPGFSLSRFLSFFMLITFAYVMVNITTQPFRESDLRSIDRHQQYRPDDE